MCKSIKSTKFTTNNNSIIKITYFLAIDRLSDGMGPTDAESQILWDTLIEHGRKYLGKSISTTYFKLSFDIRFVNL